MTACRGAKPGGAPNWFIGVPAPFEVCLEPQAGVRLFVSADLHITIAFLGPVGEARAERAFELAEPPRVSATLGEPRSLGNPKRPSALTALIDRGNVELGGLIARLAGPMRAAAGLAPEARAALPHVTLGWLGRKASPNQRRDALDWWCRQRFPGNPVKLETVALYTWNHDRRVQQFQSIRERSS